jgi:Tat protein translocase TatB subunit
VFSLGGSELLLIAAVALLVFGPDRIPQMARTVGRFMREFNKYKDIMESTKEADKPDSKTVEERMSQAGDAVQGLVAEQRAKDAAAAGEVTAEGAGAASAPAKASDPERAPACATDEDEEDEV